MAQNMFMLPFEASGKTHLTAVGCHFFLLNHYVVAQARSFYGFKTTVGELGYLGFRLSGCGVYGLGSRCCNYWL